MELQDIKCFYQTHSDADTAKMLGMSTYLFKKCF